MEVLVGQHLRAQHVHLCVIQVIIEFLLSKTFKFNKVVLGYTISGKDTFECVFDNNPSSPTCMSYWEATPPPVCIERSCASDMIRPTNGYVDPNCPQRVAINQECRIFCNPGYTIVSNNPTIVCTQNGWNTPLISQQFCQQIRCPDLIPRDSLIFIDNSQCRNAMPNSRCQFSCPTGYSLNPNINYLECNSNGQWSGPLPTCVNCES